MNWNRGVTWTQPGRVVAIVSIVGNIRADGMEIVNLIDRKTKDETIRRKPT